MRVSTIVCFALMLACARDASAYTITVYPQSSYNANVTTLNTNLGLPASFLFEDFDDATLIPQLQVSSPDTYYSSSQLHTGIGLGWTSNTVLGVGGYISPVRFTVVDGVAATFGVGITQDQGYSAGVRINGVSPYLHLGDLPNYHTSIGNPAAYRYNGYVKIVQEVGDLPISFVDFSNGGGDGIYFDHLAMDYVPVPEPASAGLLSLGGLAMIRRRRHV